MYRIVVYLYYDLIYLYIHTHTHIYVWWKSCQWHSSPLGDQFATRACVFYFPDAGTTSSRDARFTRAPKPKHVAF